MINLRRASIALLVLALGYVESHESRAQPPGFAPPVFVSPVVKREVAVGQSFVGTIRPTREAVVGSAVDGRVAEFLVTDGQLVEAKEPLAQVLTNTVKLERNAIAAELELRKRELEELREGSRSEEIAQAEAKMRAAEARSKYLAKRRERSDQLFEVNQAASEQDRDEAVAAALESKQVFLDAKAAYELAVAGPRVERIAQAEARVSMQQALLDKIEDQIKKYTVISRFKGYVVAEYTEQGAWVKSGDPVAKVVALDQVEVLAYVLEQHAPHVRRGMSVRVEVSAVPDRIFTGEVLYVVPQADERARTFPVHVRVDNVIEEDGPLLKSGMSAKAMLPTGPLQQALLVSKDAIVLGGASAAVFVIDPASADSRKGTVRLVPIQLGVAEGGLIEVRGAIKAGELVVFQGNERLRPQQEVTIARVVDPEQAPPTNAAIEN